MKFQTLEHFFGMKSTPKQIITKVSLLAIFVILLFTVTPMSYLLFGYCSFLRNKDPKQASSGLDYLNELATSVKENASKNQPSYAFDDFNELASLPSKYVKKCDIFTGEWIPNPEAPYYTNTTCWEIHEHQNCMKYGRPDSEFLKWRWKPNGCELPIFNPFQFLEIVRGKSMAFVGDSVGRNQMQSLLCLLSRVEWPIDVSYTRDFNFIRRRYLSYNFTVVTFWSPHLVRSKDAADSYGSNQTGLMNLYLDEVDEKWITQMEEFDYVIINAGHWFTRPLVFYEKQKVVGCQYCLLENVNTALNMYHGYRMAFRTAFRAINSLQDFKGMTFLRTFAPSHFENGVWDRGGDCVRTKPFRSNETQLEGMDLKFHGIQLEEFKIAEKEGKKKGLKFRLLDITQATLLRPDGHPSRYGHGPQANVTLFNDCVHWCLPGPIDTWSDFLLEMLKMEGVRSADERLHLGPA